LLGFQVVPLWAGIIVLGLHHGAYGDPLLLSIGVLDLVGQAQAQGSEAYRYIEAIPLLIVLVSLRVGCTRTRR
jgi:polar amino acid transport system permease protein